MAEKMKRFSKVLKQGSGAFDGNEIWVDNQTGVQYLFHFSGSAAGLTVLVDVDGKPLLYHRTPDAPEYKENARCHSEPVTDVTGVRIRSPLGRGYGLPHQCAHWFAMTGQGVQRSMAGCRGRQPLRTVYR